MQANQNAGVSVIVPKVVYAQTAFYKNIELGIENAKRIKPFVDYCLIITDVDPLPQEDSIIFKKHEWVDDMPTYYNHVIEESRKLNADYILFSDPDEQFNDVFLAHLRMLLITSPHINGFEVYCNLNIENHTRLDNGTFIREAPGGLGLDSNFWKLLLYKIEPTTIFEKIGTAKQSIHPHLKGNWRILKLPKYYYYTHNKTFEDIWSSSTRNQFICGGGDNEGDNNPFYTELRSICTKLDINTYRQFLQYCEKGNISEDLKKLIIDHRSDNDKYYSSEIRDVFHWYFDSLHPEENNHGFVSEYTQSESEMIDQIIQKAYFKVLGRHTDGPGRLNYINEIVSGKTSPEQLEIILMKSDEFIRNTINTQTFEVLGRVASEKEQDIWGRLIKAEIITDFGATLFATKKFVDVVIAYCQMTYKNDLDKTIENVIKAKDYVDTCIVVYDDTLNEEDIKKLIEAGARATYYKWLDNFPRQRNNYLLEARAYGATWVMVSDPDEHFDEVLFKNAKGIAAQVDKAGVSMLLVNAHDIFTDDEEGKPADNPPEHVPDYFKNLFFKLLPDAMYLGVGETQNLHENLAGSFRAMNLPKEYFYRHIKSHVEIWEHSARNIFVAGGGMNMGMQIPAYREFKQISDELGFKTWYQFRDYLKAGNIHPKMREFIIKNRNNFGHDYDSEYRELFKWYFNILHPNENVDNFTTDVNDNGPTIKPFADDAEASVNLVYKNILKRDADKSGLEHYSKEIREGRLTKDGLELVLKSSPEYRAIIGANILGNMEVRDTV